MQKWQRYQYLPGIPLGKDGRRVTASKEHIELSCRAATEGMVLLKNEGNVLPIKKGTRVALFGKGTFDYVRGGGGSGEVTVPYQHNLYDGFKLLGDMIAIYEDLCDYYRDDVNKQYENGATAGMTTEPEVPEELLKKAALYTDTAIITISRFSGEAWDRKDDFYLTDSERKMVDAVTSAFDKIIVVLNVGGVMDTSWFKDNDKIQSALMAFQAGMEGGLAMAKLLTGIVNPSGKLSDTFARLEDYPSTATFHDSTEYVDYYEDIYVGYRYFETIPGKAEKVVYPFGYGLSYTTFEISDISVKPCSLAANTAAINTGKTENFRVDAVVTNTGRMAGREVVQVYAEPPQGILGKSSRNLVAFCKTKLLESGESQRVSMNFDTYQLSSYDDLGKITKSAYILEKGDYFFHIGTSVRDTVKNDYVFNVKENVIIEQLTEKMKPSQLTKRMLSDGSFEKLETCEPNDPNSNALEPLSHAVTECFTPDNEFKPGWCMWGEGETKVLKLIDVAEGNCSMDEFLEQLTDKQLADLLGGQPNTGVADTFGFGNLPYYGIPNIMTEDGPAGVRIKPDRGVYATAWPCAILLAATWDTEIIEEVGEHAGLELKENNIGFWLTPAINIHRSPLCGRNFEYYSEDPYLTGKLAGAMVKGVQSNRVGVSVKHFALNNKETNRKDCDSRASERAIREIYLKAFEMIVKEQDPWTIMSSYNIINGYRASENKEMLTDILRGEWGFKGIVTTDWWTYGEHYKELLAGNDIKMGRGYPGRLIEALEMGLISRETMTVSVKRLLNVLLRFE